MALLPARFVHILFGLFQYLVPLGPLKHLQRIDIIAWGVEFFRIEACFVQAAGVQLARFLPIGVLVYVSWLVRIFEERD